MIRLFSSLLAFAMTLSLATGAAFATPHHHAMKATAMSATSMHPAMKHHAMSHRNHRYGNDKARCRDSKGRFLKKSDPRCLAK